ncbi:HoxN/HupN/NixA family nickel/cobalt transporter [Leptothoe sp. PORK10 BA2]|uniref:HoxN/HupN/NixA family nickel/cobalt transporter n=1 Tax=Leptothoe sp. PORK10 BA2 TaxID=3110254 RepID=UPI002B1F3C1F|nr:DUF3299 domain-containing protein [Leptothoe sp. PORK10 BA2]MEA5466913.1 DUF3299 domain-containing protein [Leptothoe sp. PORK10 BA2]
MSDSVRCQYWWRYILGFLLGVCLVLASAGPLAAQQVITWEDLQPQTTTLQNPYGHLSTEQAYDLSMLVRLQRWVDQNQVDAETFEAQEVQRLRQKLEDQGLDVARLLTQVDQAQAYWQEQSQSTNMRLEEQAVTLSGYVLPLAWDQEQRVTQFLLVPYVGACIHVPPPPPNQIVYVEPAVAIETPGLFASVSVTGQLRQQSASYDLFRVDGTRSVDVSYALALTDITLNQPESGESALSIPAGPIWKTLPVRVSAVLTQAMGNLHSQRSTGAFLFGLLLAFSYGVLHTLGPGHGKAVIISYFVGKGGSLRRGLVMGVRIAVVHVLSAIVVVVLTDTVVRQAGGSTPDNYRIVQLISYGAIATIGAWLLWQALHTVQEPHHNVVVSELVLSPSLTQQLSETKPRLPQLCNCLTCDDREGGGGWLSLAIGAVPCSGALLVLLYGLANNLLWPSVAMVLAISVGMAITLAWIGAMAIMGRQYAERRLGKRQQWLTQGVRILGASCVLLLGLGLFGVTLASGGLSFALP